MDNAQELRRRKMNLMAEYYGPEDPGRNPAFMMDKDKDVDGRNQFIWTSRKENLFQVGEKQITTLWNSTFL